MGMLHSSSGRRGFDPPVPYTAYPQVTCPDDCEDNLPDLPETLSLSRQESLDFLKEEEARRNSPEIQAAFTEAERIPGSGFQFVAEQLQIDMSTRFACCTCKSKGPDAARACRRSQCALNDIRRAKLKYPNDPEILNSVCWMRENISSETNLMEGDIIPNVTIATMDGATISLSDAILQSNSKAFKSFSSQSKTLIIASSIS